MNRYLMILLAFVVGACTAPPDKKVLIYTKNGAGYVHDNIPAATQALEELCAEANIEYEITEDPLFFTEDYLKDIDAVIFNNTNNDAFDTDEQRLAFRRYIQAGGGFVGIHSACGSERNWPWFWAMLGGKFYRHPTYQSFRAKIIDKNHPSTSHFNETWEREDECYYLIQLNPGIHVLMVHDLTTVEDPGKQDYPGDTFGDQFPSAWYQEFEGGREWYTTYGHNPKDYEDLDYRKHLIGGILWVIDKDKPDFSRATALDIGPVLHPENQ